MLVLPPEKGGKNKGGCHKQQTALTSQTEFVETPAGKVAFEVGEMDDLFSVGANFTQRADSANRSEMVAEKNPSELSSQPQNSLQPQPDKNAEKIRAEGGKPSVCLLYTSRCV